MPVHPPVDPCHGCAADPHICASPPTAADRQQQEENTLVYFAGDNGGERWSYLWPLSGEKFVLQEGGIRIPTIVRWPHRVDGDQVSHEPNFSPDWTATFLEPAGARPDPAYPLDGTSLAGYLLKGEQPPERDLFWRVRANRALRRGDWKYYQDEDGDDHLFDLGADLRERADLAPDKPELLAELKAAWEKIASGLLPYPS
ncbi:sulfatase-like hydrolase/transferase [Streptomyces prunicolor]